MKNAIETENLTKVYNNNFTAVNSLNLEIPNESIFGMLGPNGAGKTTTIKMLTCLIQPTSGKAMRCEIFLGWFLSRLACIRI